MSHIQIIKSIPDTPDIISFDEIRKSIFFESSQYFLRYLTDLFTDLITRLPKQEQLYLRFYIHCIGLYGLLCHLIKQRFDKLHN